MSGLGSAPPEPPSFEERVRGPSDAPLVIAYTDVECPYCALAHQRLRELRRARVALRHFPVRSTHPRAWPAACAVEAAGTQGRLWEMLDALLADQGRLEDPHLWRHAEALGLDLERFDAERRSDAVAAVVKRDFEGGIRAGVMATPTLFVGDDVYAGEGDLDSLLRRFGG